MSLFRKSDYYREAQGKRSKGAITPKTKLPTVNKTKLSICPRCSKKGYIRSKGHCIICEFDFTPNKPMEVTNGRLS